MAAREVCATALSVALCVNPALATRRLCAQSAADPRSALLVSTGWLAEHVKDRDLVLLHVGEKSGYEAAHLPGARYVSLSDISVENHDHEKDTGLSLELPPDAVLRTKLEALGISDGSRVVVYFGKDWVTPATRVILTLDRAGLGARASLLDGGLPAWTAEGRATTTAVTAPTTGKLAPLHTKPVVVDAAWVKAHLGAPNTRVVDGRAAVFYDGIQQGRGQRPGHIAGAKNIPFTEITDDNLRLKSARELAALFTKAGVGPRDTVVAYCHIGQQGTAVVFAARTLGHPVYLYDGSYEEWSRNAQLPVENPAAGKP
jgi:thiosulfate/3-mercaptopyruvate sulfurtransferase